MKPWFKVTVLAAVACLIGCESGDSGSDWDFGTNDPSLYVCCGDSITQGVLSGASAPYPSILASILGKTVVNEGHSGYTSSEGIGVVRSAVDRYHPGYVLILFGANDLIHVQDANATVANLRAMVQYAKGSSTRPLVGTCLPMIGDHAVFNDAVNALNPMIIQMASEEGVTVVDLNAGFAGAPEQYLGSDGLHPNVAGNQLIADMFAGAL